MDAIRIRDGVPRDVGAMHALDRECFAHPFAFDLRAMRRFATQAGAGITLAEVSAELAGFVIVQRYRNGHAYVVTLDVHPGFRRRGVARALMVAAEAAAREQDAVRMTLHVHTGNAAAVACYQALGYTRSGLQPEFYGPDVDAWVYAKNLEPQKG